MWVAWALVAAVGSATTTLVLKRAVERGGVVASTISFRIVGGILLVLVVAALGARPVLTPAYWRTVALVMPPEVIGMLCMSLALRTGELSQVQPLFGLMPLFVAVNGAIFLGEIPTPVAATGILLVAAGVYCVGLQGGGRLLEPLRALARSRVSWYAVAGSLAWSVTSVLHKVGIAQVGPFAWGVTLALGSALVLAAIAPLLARVSGDRALPSKRGAPWLGLVAGAGALFAVQQAGLQLAMTGAQAGYVTAVSSTSTVLATALGVAVLGERATAGARLAGSALVAAGAALIALAG